MQVTIVLLVVGWLLSTRARRLGPSESLIAATAFTLAMVIMLYFRRFQ